MKRCLVIVGGCLLLLSCVQSKNVPVGYDLQGPSNRVIAFDLEIADDPSEQQVGLMHRTSLVDNAGMLFVFAVSHVQTFWMKNTLIPLDIIFFDDAGLFVSTKTMVPCTADPCPFYSSELPATYALEVNAGTVQEHGIGPGWRLMDPRRN